MELDKIGLNDFQESMFIW